MDDLQRPPPYPYRSRSASVMLPSYRVQRRHDELTLVFQPLESRLSRNRYVYESQTMTLDLGQREPGVGIPAYGNNAIVQGTLVVKDLKHVIDISLTITGKASYTILECGYPILQQSKTVLHHSIPLWSSSQPPPNSPSTFTISFPLPTYARWSSSLLPPTTRFIQGNFRLTVNYEIAVQLIRRGKLRRDERVATEFAYAPRTIPDLSPSILNSCRGAVEGTAEGEESKSNGIVRWKVVNLRPSTPVKDDTSVLLHLPSPTSYPSGISIPFRILISSQRSLDLPSLSGPLNSPDTVSVELVKIISFRIGKTRVLIECIIGRSIVWKVERSDGKGDLEVMGCIEGIKKGSETSWSLGLFVECTYTIRATVKLPLPSHAFSATHSTQPPASRTSAFTSLSLVRSMSSSTSSNKSQPFITYRHDEPIHLCTDEVEAFEVEAEDAWERPALGLLPNTGESLSSRQPSRMGRKGWQFFRRVRLGPSAL